MTPRLRWSLAPLLLVAGIASRRTRRDGQSRRRAAVAVAHRSDDPDARRRCGSTRRSTRPDSRGTAGSADPPVFSERRTAPAHRNAGARRDRARRSLPPRATSSSLQDIRGRFKSEGPVRDAAAAARSHEREGDRREHRHLRHHRLAARERARTTTGASGSSGTSYGAWLAVMGMLDPHPALKAVVAAGFAGRHVAWRRLPSQRRVPAELRPRIRVHDGVVEGDRQPAAIIDTLRHLRLVSRSSARWRTPTRSTSTKSSRPGTTSSAILTTTPSGSGRRSRRG